MFSRSFLRGLDSHRPRTRAKDSRRPSARTRLSVEALEGRALLSFAAAQAFDTGVGPNSVAIADFNGDGLEDVAVANRGTYIFYADDGSVSVHLGNGDGTFQPARYFAAGLEPVSVAVGDLNGDGRLDLAVANTGSKDASVLLGNGDGSFQPARNFPTGVGASCVNVADFNGDGRPDLAVVGAVEADPPGAYVLSGNGDGTFQPAQYFGTAPEPASAVAADFDRDGRLDLAVACRNSGGGNTGLVSMLLGNGDGTFQVARDWDAGGYYSSSVAAADVNGDGRLDLAVANSGSDNVAVRLGNGDGTFQTARTFASDVEPASVALGDVNGDGRLDLAVACHGADSSHVSVLLGNGNGTFQAAHDYAAGWQPSFVAMGEFNSDNRLDLAVAGAGAGIVSVHLGIGNGAFQAAPILPDVWTTATGDFNGDGRPDLAGFAATADIDGVAVALGNGDGTFRAARAFATDVYSFFVAAGDFNGDGRLDLAAANLYRQNVSVLLGNGDGTFKAAQNYAVGSGPMHIAIGDVNGDGRLDLAVANQYDSSVSVLLGTGDGSFQPAGTVAGNGVLSVALADFNGDGRSDLAMTNAGSGSVSMLLSNADGTFQAPLVLEIGGNPDSVAAGDVNGDGRPDLATTGASDSVSVFLGNGDGTFQSARNVAVPSPHFVAIADLSGDGRPDLIVNSATVRVLLGNGDGTFQSNSMSNLARGLVSIWLAVADFNGDGLLDVATADGSILINEGNWTSSPHPNLPEIRVGDATVTEGNSGTRLATFTVTLSARSTKPVTVKYTTKDGTANSPGDYTSVSGTLTFAPGETSKLIKVVVKGDRIAEPDETFNVNLSAATNATLADGQGLGTIIDDEPRISINDVTKVEGRSGTTQFSFTITLLAAYDQPVTISFKTVDGSAKTTDNDYRANAGTLTFMPGETTKKITIVVQGDTKRELNEVFYVDLSGKSSNMLFIKKRGIGTILNDD